MEAVIKAINVRKYFPLSVGIFSAKKYVRAIDNVDLELYSGEVLALVGESGSGKSTLGRVIVGLQKPDAGEVLYRGHNIYRLNNSLAKLIRHKIQAVFQNPDSSLNPRMQIFDILSEALLTKNPELSKAELLDGVVRLLRTVGLSDDHVFKYPHELSGGERQRIAIARALSVEPEVLIADEIVSALDVSVRAQVMNVLMDIIDKYRLSVIFITHDMGLVWSISDRVAVMYLGRIVEIGPTEEIFKSPLHPYTKMLLVSSPTASSTMAFKDLRFKARGEPPSPIDPPKGCKFVTRCPLADERCNVIDPQLNGVSENHKVACIKVNS
ncbi:MAG: ATP-binding cassette domain-containing protein [Sulfolobales archaeon]|nr:ATP-binding cassette domain-containing protein [Sulfolobales archaeon]